MSGVKSAGRRAASSRWLEWLARGGFVACGVNYLLIGVLAVQIGVGAGGEAADASGAMHAVVAYPGGFIALWLVAIGFAGLALWRLAEVAYGQASPERRYGRQAAGITGPRRRLHRTVHRHRRFPARCRKPAFGQQPVQGRHRHADELYRRPVTGPAHRPRRRGGGRQHDRAGRPQDVHREPAHDAHGRAHPRDRQGLRDRGHLRARERVRRPRRVPRHHRCHVRL